MSKKENKRFKDRERSTAPKRGGKNRRDYGGEYSYEPKRRTAPAGAKKSSPRPGSPSDARGGQRRVLGFDLEEKDAPLIGTDGLEVVAGRNPVTEALCGGRDVERVFIADGSEGSVSKIIAIAREQGVIVDFVPKEKIDAMAPGAKHQGVVAKVSEYRYADMEEVFAKASESGEDPFIIILDEVTDPHNLGAIIRTAECAGAHGVIIPKRRAASLTQTVALAAAGAVEVMPVVQVTNISRTIEDLKKQGHVKKENIGLIEVMGLAILPPRVRQVMEERAMSRDDVGVAFGQVLEHAGVFKWDDAGRDALHRFLACV